MDIPDPEPSSGDTRFAGTTTGHVRVGRYILDVPSPGGTTLTLAPRRARTEPPPELTTALAQEQGAAPERSLADRANQLLDTAEAVTDKVEHVTDTVQAILAGRIPDPELISGDLLEWLGLMQRLVQSGRFAEAVKLGRPLCRLFGLTLRWAALVETLRLTFHAATALADTPTIAWTQHELGTLHGSVGDVGRARELLEQARSSREAIGDRDGLRATDHNLKVLSQRALIPKSRAALAGVGVVVLIAAVLVVAETVSGGSSPGSVAASSTSSTTRSSTTTVTADHSTTSHSSSVQVDSHPFIIKPTQLNFGTVAPGTSSNPQTITLDNGGQAPETITPAQITGTDPTDFAITSDGCGGRTVPAQTSCPIVVTFTPTAVGSKSAIVSFADGGATGQVDLSGTAASPPGAAPRPDAVKFAATVGQSASNEVELVNTGSDPLTVTSAEIASGSEFAVTSNMCETVAAGAFCTVTVEFTPTAAGDATATLTFTDNADPTTQQVPLFATGEAPAPPTTTPTTPTPTTTPPSGGTTTQPPPG